MNTGTDVLRSTAHLKRDGWLVSSQPRQFECDVRLRSKLSQRSDSREETATLFLFHQMFLRQISSLAASHAPSSCPLTPAPFSLCLCPSATPPPPLSANFQRCRRGHSEGRTLPGGERLVGRGYTRRTTLGCFFFFFAAKCLREAESASVFFLVGGFGANRPRTTLREPGGEPTSTWRTRSTTRDGSSSTSSAKVSASVCAGEG